MDFDRLVMVFEQLERTSSGNELRVLLADFLKEATTKEVPYIAYLTLGRVGADFEGIVFGMAEKSVLKAIGIASGMSNEKLKNLLSKTGDIGLCAEAALQKKPRTLAAPEPLTIFELHSQLVKLGGIVGDGSTDTKANIVAALLQRTTPLGAKYITRIILGTLRLGVAEMAVLDALAIAFTGEKKNKAILESAYNICPDVGVIAKALVDGGIEAVEKLDVEVGRPIQMMLCQRVEHLAEVFDNITPPVAVEEKYDGERVQAHKDKKGKITLFSRRLDNITGQFPDLVKELNSQIKTSTFIVEGEILAIGTDGNPLPFQTLMQRRRKYDVNEYMTKVPIQLKVFDLLYVDGKSLLTASYEERNKKLKMIAAVNAKVTLADVIITSNLDEIEAFFHQMLESGFEGIIVKSLADDSVYQAGTRGWNWIKWKKEYVHELVDNFDVVIVGAYHGRGRRSGTYGAFLCACYNPKKDQFETVCKLGTGLTDAMLAELPVMLKKYTVLKKPVSLVISKEMEPEVWFDPHMVVEVKAAEVTKSPFHTAGSGLALRFPRFVRFRDDKKPEQATTCKEVEDIYLAKRK